MPEPFPDIGLDLDGDDANPAVQLFGRRLFRDQTPLEFLAELLLVASSTKHMGDVRVDEGEPLPALAQMRGWPQNGRAVLRYSPHARLSLKLFAFLGASKLETRHACHMAHYRELLRALSAAIRCPQHLEKREVLQTLENLFLGFQGIGQNRTWCAQVFLPVTAALVAAEAVWRQTRSVSEAELTWEKSFPYFGFSQRLFMARGGELLYLQLCNALGVELGQLQGFIAQHELLLDGNEQDPASLRDALCDGILSVTSRAPQALDRVAVWLDNVDGETADKTDSRSVECAWCPKESWPEGYLFAVELQRICRAAIDPIEKVEMLTICCVFQALRSLCAQSARYSDLLDKEARSLGSATGFAWVLSPPTMADRTIRHLSARNLVRVQDLIFSALRHPDIRPDPRRQDGGYREADTRYGHKLFLSLAKKTGFVIPYRGPGARFTLNDQLLRFLVLALVRPGERCSLVSFKDALYKHYGLAVDGDHLRMACRWSELPELGEAATGTGAWFEEMLRESGFLVELSDAFSLVRNPFGTTQDS